jgi:hypothetical protein
MEVKRIGDKLQATLDAGEVLRLAAHNGPKVSDLVRAAVWRTLQVHAFPLLDGMTIGWSAIDVVNTKFVVTFGPVSSLPDHIVIPEAKK